MKSVELQSELNEKKSDKNNFRSKSARCIRITGCKDRDVLLTSVCLIEPPRGVYSMCPGL